MQVTFDFSEVRQLSPEMAAAIKESLNRAQSTIAEQALVCQASMKSHAPVDTGNLRNSITKRVTTLKATIGTNVEYAPYQEYGTYKMAAHPFAEPAANEVEGNIAQALEAAIGDIL